MAIGKFRGYILLTGLSFITALGMGVFMFVQFRGMMINYTDFSKRIHYDNTEYLSKVTLAKMAEYVEKQYPILYDTARLKQEAGTDRFWKTADEWREIADIFGFAYIYYIEKKDDNYIFLMSSDIRRDYHPEWLHSQVWTENPPAFYDEAWETKQLAVSPKPYNDGWGTLITAAWPIISNGSVVGILGVDYDVSYFEKQKHQELELEKQEKLLLEKMRNILLFSIAIIAFICYYQVWLSNTSVIVPMREAEADERTRLMLDATPMICTLWDAEGRILDCNKEALNIFGVGEKSEYIEHFYDFHPQYQSNGESTRDMMARLFKTTREDKNMRIEWMANTASGEALPLESTVVCVPWKKSWRFAVYSQDLREIRAKEEAVRESENSLRRILATVEASPNLTLFLGADGNIEYMNPAVSEVSGFSREELQKSGLALIFSPGDFQRLYRDYIAAALKKELANFEMTVVAKNGAFFDFYFSAFAVKMSDASIGIGLLGRDITELKRMQTDLAIAKDQAERALASEIQYNKAKSDFLSRVSHELRTPLNIIVGMTTIAKKTGEKKEWDRCIVSINEATEHLLELVNDIVDMTGFDTGRFDLVPRPFSFNSMLGTVIDNISPKALAKQQVFITQIDNKICDRVVSDERRLKQVLMHLLLNAVKFTPETGKIELAARMLENDEKECAVRFEVIDNGIGISPETLKHLGEDFEQADNTITRKYSGMGLGLSLTKRIVKLMKGELRVESEPGKGSRFICDVRLGVAQAKLQEEGGATNSTTANAAVSLDLTGKRIMVVDDVDLNREIIHLLLEDTGAIIDEASTGDEAVRMFSREKYDLVLMDLHMPVMDGFIATKSIRVASQPWARTIPIISVSAETSAEVHLKCFEAGITDHLPKPIEMEALFEMIAKLLPETNS